MERDQLALDRYVKSINKSKWQIGRDYELSVAYEWVDGRCMSHQIHHVQYCTLSGGTQPFRALRQHNFNNFKKSQNSYLRPWNMVSRA